MNRRDFFGMTSKALIASSIVGSVGFPPLWAQQEAGGGTPPLPLIPRSHEGRILHTWQSPVNCYTNYPHANSTIPGTYEMVIGQQNDGSTGFLAWDFKTGKTRSIYNAPANHMFFDLSETTGEMVLIQNRRQVVVIQTKGEPKPQIIYEHDQKLVGMICISNDGKRILLTEPIQPPGEKLPTEVIFIELNRETRKTTKLFSVPFFGNHQQYSPYDQNWIGFCREGDVSKTFDRVWGWKPGGQPEQLWDEKGSRSGMLIAGHERWVFHKPGVVAIAYPHSPGEPRGLYYIDAPTKKATLISESNCDWHCNIDRTGTWALTDSIGQWRPPAEGIAEWKDCQGVSDVTLVHVATGKRFWMARSHIGPKGHPWHPHPNFTHDGKYITYNDYDYSGKPCIVVAEIKFPM